MGEKVGLGISVQVDEPQELGQRTAVVSNSGGICESVNVSGCFLRKDCMKPGKSRVSGGGARA